MISKVKKRGSGLVTLSGVALGKGQVPFFTTLILSMMTSAKTEPDSIILMIRPMQDRPCPVK